tara:strand:+ start:103 stop:531 length:429 start_codon:yes stop_codon:yes gene_type:complete
MKVFGNFLENLELHDKGSKLELGNEEGTILYVRRANHNWDKALKDCKMHLFGVYYSEHTLTTDQRQQAVALAISEYLVAGWENLIDEETGIEVKYSKPNSASVFGNPELYLSLNFFILNHANSHENYLYEKLEEDKEALKKP